MYSLKNIAIVAHVDHGKTTLVDELLKQSETLKNREKISERVMDSGDIEKERGITITAKNCALHWKGVKINLLDTPGHADFGGEVERSLMMVDGVMLLVDASEGPLPQTRFVLQKALERNLKVAVVINKIDRQDERIMEVKEEIEDLFLELASLIDHKDFDLDFPIVYSSAKEGWATLDPAVKRDDMHPILDLMIGETFPSPVINEGLGLQILVSNISYSEYLGSLFIGRIARGTLCQGKNYILCDKEGIDRSFKLSHIQIYKSLSTIEVKEVQAGEIVICGGLDHVEIGDSICDLDCIEPLERISVEPPTVSVNVSVNTSPFSGREGEYLTGRKLEEFLDESTKNNVALRYSKTDDPKVYKLMGRGELQLAIVFEELRRKGFEVMVSRPKVLTRRDENDQLLEPFEKLIIDIPSTATGTLTKKLAERKGTMNSIVTLGDTRIRLEFIIPSRGLIGYRSIFLTDTRGEGLMSSEFLGYRPYAGDILARTNGAIVSDRSGKMTPYALFNLLNNGAQFVEPQEACYEGMVIGAHNRVNDINVNCVREKHLSSMRTAGKDVNIILPPIVQRTIDWALDWIDDDEWVEITPLSLRIRKKILSCKKRSVIRHGK